MSSKHSDRTAVLVVTLSFLSHCPANQHSLTQTLCSPLCAHCTVSSLLRWMTISILLKGIKAHVKEFKSSSLCAFIWRIKVKLAKTLINNCIKSRPDMQHWRTLNSMYLNLCRLSSETQISSICPTNNPTWDTIEFYKTVIWFSYY